MARTELTFEGVGDVKMKWRGMMDGKLTRSYEVAFVDARVKAPLDEHQFEAAPEVGQRVKLVGRVETDAKARLKLFVASATLVADDTPVGSVGAGMSSAAGGSSVVGGRKAS